MPFSWQITGTVIKEVDPNRLITQIDRRIADRLTQARPADRIGTKRKTTTPRDG